jgi:hypothetical protein
MAVDVLPHGMFPGGGVTNTVAVTQSGGALDNKHQRQIRLSQRKPLRYHMRKEDH